MVFLNGMARAVMTVFLSIFWKELGMNSKQIAIGSIFGILLEVAIFFFGQRLVFMGNYWMLILAQGAMVFRTWAYAVLPQTNAPLWVYWLVELSKGVAFGFTHSAGVKLASEAAPPGLEATAQALYTSIYSQLPAVIAGLIGSYLAKMYGLGRVFLCAAVGSTAALALLFVKYLGDGSITLNVFHSCRKRVPRLNGPAAVPFASGQPPGPVPDEKAS